MENNNENIFNKNLIGPPSSQDKDDFDVNNYPKEVNKFLNLPPAISSSLQSNNYDFPPQIPSQYPIYSYNDTNNLSNNIYSSYSNHGNYNNYNSMWNNPYQKRNFQFRHSAIPSVISRIAEDKMKPAFKSIEMILETFSSINMILDSTYSALYGSFRTIISVADHLVFIRNHLAELALFPRIAHLLIDFLKWLFKFLGLSHSKIARILERRNNEDVWNEALSHSSVASKNALSNNEPNSSLWPVVIFFSLVIGTPYIVWRLLGASETIPRTNLPVWTLKNGRHFVAVGLYNFKARNSNELSFQKGQILFIKPESLQPDSKWLVACTIDNQLPQIGLIPLNFIKLLNK